MHVKINFLNWVDRARVGLGFWHNFIVDGFVPFVINVYINLGIPQSYNLKLVT